MKDSISAEEREKLYEEIWAEPMSKVAPRYGVSDVWLRKKCTLWDIPIPSREYRGRVAHGQKPWKTPLPELSGEAKRYVYGYAVTYIDIESLPDAALYYEEPLFVFSDATKTRINGIRKGIDVPTSLKFLTEKQRERLKELEKDRKCKSTVPYRRLFSIMCAIGQCICDMEGRTYVGPDETELMVAKTIWIVKYQVTTQKEKSAIGLTFTEHLYWSERNKKEFVFSDTEDEPLEDQAGEIIYKLFFESGKILLIKEQERRQKLKEEAEAAWQRKLAPYIKEENEKVAKALEDAVAYKNAIAIRDYADAYYKKNGTLFSEKPELQSYYNWLLRRADWVDPLIENDYDALLRGES